MTLSQTARSQFNTRQKNRLKFCLATAIVAHGLLFVGWSLDRQENRKAQQKDPIGVEFVYLDPSASQPGKTESSRRAQINSAAGGTNNPNLPVSAGKKSQPPSAPPTPNRPTNPAPPLPAPPLPRSPISPAPPLPSSRPTTPQPTVTERAAAQSPATQAIQPAIPQAAPAPRPANPSAVPAAPPTNPQSGQGLDGQINPDRTLGGTASIDAAGDELWGVYVSTLNRQIDQNWQRITVPAIRQAKVQFEVDRLGRLVTLQLVQSSGDSEADTVAMQAVRLAAPFTPFPEQTTESRLRVNFTFTYYPANQAPASRSPGSPGQ